MEVMFGSSLPQVLFALFVFTWVWWYPARVVLCFSSSCVLCIISFSGMSIFDCILGILYRLLSTVSHIAYLVEHCLRLRGVWSLLETLQYTCFIIYRIKVFNANSNSISAISWRSVLLVEEIGAPRENHRPAASHLQTLSHKVVSSTPRHQPYANWKL